MGFFNFIFAEAKCHNQSEYKRQKYQKYKPNVSKLSTYKVLLLCYLCAKIRNKTIHQQCLTQKKYTEYISAYVSKV